MRGLVVMLATGVATRASGKQDQSPTPKRWDIRGEKALEILRRRLNQGGARKKWKRKS